MSSSQTQNTYASRPSASSSPCAGAGARRPPSSDRAAGFTIADEDITFDGQPLSALYEMTRYRCVQCDPASREPQPEERGRKRHR